MNPPRYLASLAILIVLTACETTRVNNQKPTARALICNVPDRCTMTP